MCRTIGENHAIIVDFFFGGECGCGSSFPILGSRRPSLWYQRCLHTKRNFALSHGQLIKAGRRELESDR